MKFRFNNISSIPHPPMGICSFYWVPENKNYFGFTIKIKDRLGYPRKKHISVSSIYQIFFGTIVFKIFFIINFFVTFIFRQFEKIGFFRIGSTYIILLPQKLMKKRSATFA